jgi:CheY-like chemotaxis protein
MRVLVVDDDDIVQSLVRDACEDEGHSVLTPATARRPSACLKTLPSTC